MAGPSLVIQFEFPQCGESLVDSLLPESCSDQRTGESVFGLFPSVLSVCLLSVRTELRSTCKVAGCD